MSDSAANQPRQPKGVPTGGQWKATNRPEGKGLKATKASLDDFRDERGDPIFPDPDHVGSSEYRAIYDLLADVVDSLEGPGEQPEGAGATDAADYLAASLQELQDWASVLSTRLRLAAQHA